MSESFEDKLKFNILNHTATMNLYRICAKKVQTGEFEERKKKFENCLNKSKLLSQLEFKNSLDR